MIIGTNSLGRFSCALAAKWAVHMELSASILIAVVVVVFFIAHSEIKATIDHVGPTGTSLVLPSSLLLLFSVVLFFCSAPCYLLVFVGHTHPYLHTHTHTHAIGRVTIYVNKWKATRTLFLFERCILWAARIEAIFTRYVQRKCELDKTKKERKE